MSKKDFFFVFLWPSQNIWTFNNFQKFSSVYHFINEFILLYLLTCLHLECFEDQGEFLVYWRTWGTSRRKNVIIIVFRVGCMKCHNRFCFVSLCKKVVCSVQIVSVCIIALSLALMSAATVHRGWKKTMIRYFVWILQDFLYYLHFIHYVSFCLVQFFFF